PIARAISRASATSTRRGLAGMKFSPIALAPASTATSASATLVTPQIFTCTARDVTARSRVDLEQLFHFRDHLRRLDRLRDVRVRAELHGALTVFLRPLR